MRRRKNIHESEGDAPARRGTAALLLLVLFLPLAIYGVPASSQEGGDLELVTAVPFHSAFGSTVFVKNKLLKIRAEIESTFPETVAVDITTWELTREGPKGIEDENNDWDVERILLAPGRNVLFLPRDRDVLAPNGLLIEDDDDPNLYCFEVVVDHCPPGACAGSGGRFDETDEGNNRISDCVPYVTTKQLRIAYVPVALGGPGSQNRNPPSCESILEFGFRSSEYIRGTFPIADFGQRTLVDEVSCEAMDFPDVDFDNLEKVNYELEALSWFQESGDAYDMLVGVWGRGAIPSYGGLAFGLLHHAVTVAEEWRNGIGAAHEISHTLRWARAAEQPPPLPGATLCATQPGSHICGLESPGYWIRRQCVMGSFEWSNSNPTGGICNGTHNPLDYMFGGSPPTLVDRWISNFTWDHLTMALDEDCAHNFNKSDFCNPDPKVIGMGAVIHGDGTATLLPWYVFDGVTDVPLDNPGRFRVRYLDEREVAIAETGFSALGENLEADDADRLLSLRIPFVEGTRSVRVSDGDEVLFERDVSSGIPEASFVRPAPGALLEPGEEVQIEWTGSDPDGDDGLRSYPLFRRERGAFWLPIGPSGTETQASYTVPSDFEAGESLQIRVVVTDGVNTSEARSDLSVMRLEEIEIDVRPGEEPNSVNCGNEQSLVSVAALGGARFDATKIEQPSVRFGRQGSEAAAVHARSHVQDVNGDSLPDRVFHFRFGDTGLDCDDRIAQLRGVTVDGLGFRGEDEIRTVAGGAQDIVPPGRQLPRLLVKSGEPIL